jgi:hypothetical protein
LGPNDIRNNKIYEKWLPFQPYQADVDVSGDLHIVSESLLVVARNLFKKKRIGQQKMMSWGDLPTTALARPTVLSPEDQKRLEYRKKLELQQSIFETQIFILV